MKINNVGVQGEDNKFEGDRQGSQFSVLEIISASEYSEYYYRYYKSDDKSNPVKHSSFLFYQTQNIKHKT